MPEVFLLGVLLQHLIGGAFLAFAAAAIVWRGVTPPFPWKPFYDFKIALSQRFGSIAGALLLAGFLFRFRS